MILVASGIGRLPLVDDDELVICVNDDFAIAILATRSPEAHFRDFILWIVVVRQVTNAWHHSGTRSTNQFSNCLLLLGCGLPVQVLVGVLDNVIEFVKCDTCKGNEIVIK